MKEGRKLEYPQKTLGDELQKMPYYSPKIQAPSEIRTRTIALARKAGVLIVPRVAPSAAFTGKLGSEQPSNFNQQVWTAFI